MKHVFLTEEELYELLRTAVLTTLKEMEEDKEQPDEWLTRKQAAAYYQISLASIDNYVRDGRIKKHRVGKSVRFLKSELDEAMQSFPKYSRK